MLDIARPTRLANKLCWLHETVAVSTLLRENTAIYTFGPKDSQPQNLAEHIHFAMHLR